MTFEERIKLTTLYDQDRPEPEDEPEPDTEPEPDEEEEPEVPEPTGDEDLGPQGEPLDASCEP